MHNMAYTLMPTSKVENSAKVLSHWLKCGQAKTHLTKLGQRGKFCEGNLSNCKVSN